MKNGFFKTFALGLLWALLFPFILVGVLLVAVYGVFVFIVEFFLMLLHFFQGKKLFPLFKEDEKALKILQGEIDKQKAGETPAQPQPQTIVINQNYYGYPGAPVPSNFNQAIPNQNPPVNSLPGQSFAQGQIPPTQPIGNTPQYSQLPQNNPPLDYTAASAPKLQEFPQSDESEGK